MIERIVNSYLYECSTPLNAGGGAFLLYVRNLYLGYMANWIFFDSPTHQLIIAGPLCVSLS